MTDPARSRVADAAFGRAAIDARRRARRVVLRRVGQNFEFVKYVHTVSINDMKIFVKCMGARLLAQQNLISNHCGLSLKLTKVNFFRVVLLLCYNVNK